jgi:hypothetical protein
MVPHGFLKENHLLCSGLSAKLPVEFVCKVSVER